MMTAKNTCERIKAVAKHYGLRPALAAGSLHAFFDRLDKKAGIRTQYPDACKKTPGRACNHTSCRAALYVGERLLYHEAKMNNAEYHFWLGDGK